MYELFYSPMNGKVSGIRRLGDNASIPLDERNADFHDFLKWNLEQEIPLDLNSTIEPDIPEPVRIEDLPTSQHLARIKSIDVSKAKPITVTREYEGQEFDINCVVTEDIKEQYQAGKINTGDIVIVTYCEERQDQAIVLSKIFKSW